MACTASAVCQRPQTVLPHASRRKSFGFSSHCSLLSGRMQTDNGMTFASYWLLARQPIAPPRFFFCSLSWLARSIVTHVFSCRNTDHERYLHCGFSDVMLPLSFDLSPCTDYRKQLPYLIAPIIFGSSAVLRRPAIPRKARPATEPDVYWPSPKELK